MSLHFTFQDVLDEIDSIAKVTKHFVAAESTAVLPQLRATLESIKANRSGLVVPWGIKDNHPLRTVESLGQYEPGDGGGHIVIAEITSRWDIACVVDPAQAKKIPKFFSLEGVASTRVRILDVDNEGAERELATWRMEVGDDQSPGCHFHVQVLGEEHHQLFPHSFPVPRFPSLIITPMAVLEFVLAELFQDEWRKHAATESADMQRWKPIQQKRLLELLRWQQECIRDASGSPWTSFKARKPLPQIFIPE